MTRVEKYEVYRSKLISDGDRVLESANERTNTIGVNTTSTLPIKEVYKSLETQEKNEDELIKIRKNQIRARYIFIGIALGLVLIALIILAIYAFKN